MVDLISNSSQVDSIAPCSAGRFGSVRPSVFQVDTQASATPPQETHNSIQVEKSWWDWFTSWFSTEEENITLTTPDAPPLPQTRSRPILPLPTPQATSSLIKITNRAEQARIESVADEVERNAREATRLPVEETPLTDTEVLRRLLKANSEQGKIQNSRLELFGEKLGLTKSYLERIHQLFEDLEQKRTSSKERDKVFGYVQTGLLFAGGAAVALSVAGAAATSFGSLAPYFVPLSSWALQSTNGYLQACVLATSGTTTVARTFNTKDLTTMDATSAKLNEEMTAERHKQSLFSKDIEQTVKAMKKQNSFTSQIVRKFHQLKSE